MSLAVCPRCHSILTAVAGVAGVQRCRRCQGAFARGEQPDGDAAVGDRVDSAAPAASRPLEDAAATISCPHCLTGMAATTQPSEFDCPSCGGRWVDGETDRPAETANDAQPTDAPSPQESGKVPLSAFTKNLLYGVSLPERLLRSGIGLTAGAVKEVAGVLIPQAFQSAKSYEIAIENSLSFLTETIGGVADPTAADDEAGEHIARKAVGNFVDLAGLATLHVSPMWMLAAVSDIAYGSKTYVREVALELKQQGVIDDASTIHQIDDILDAIQRSSGSAASTFDKPPLSVDELRTTLGQIRAELGDADLKKLLPEHEVRRLWTEMQSAATQEHVGLLGVSSAMTMQMLDEVKTVSTGALTGIRVAGGLFDRNVLDHYRESLTRIRENGFYDTVAESYKPYVDALWHNFAGERETWTEQLLDPNNITKTVNKLFSFLEEGEGKS